MQKYALFNTWFVTFFSTPFSTIYFKSKTPRIRFFLQVTKFTKQIFLNTQPKMYNFRMIKRTLLFRTFSLIVFLLASCTPKKVLPDPNIKIQISQAVAATIAAMPIPTQVTPPTPYPTPTAVSLAGLYCEYQFCIGHPSSVAFYDHLATLDVGAPSKYGNGFIYAYQIPSVVISLIWLQAPGTTDPNFLLETILEDQSDIASGSPEVKLIHNMNVLYTPITTSIAEVPFGSAGAWTCGDRVFAWKSYTQQADIAASLFAEAISRFTCGQ
jgi:hypothetical protein